ASDSAMVAEPITPKISNAVPAAISEPVPTVPSAPSRPPATTGVIAMTSATTTAPSQVALTASAVVRNQCATDRARTAAASTVTRSSPWTTQCGSVVGTTAASGTSGRGPRETANTLTEASPRWASPPTTTAPAAATTLGRYAAEIAASD